jgi:hypothetical protein
LRWSTLRLQPARRARHHPNRETPTVVVIDRHGRVIANQSGPESRAALVLLIERSTAGIPGGLL